MKQLCRELSKLKRANAMIFLILLDQTVKKLEPPKQNDLEKIAATIMLCVKKFASMKNQQRKKCQMTGLRTN